MPDDVYTHGHHPTVLRSHTWRTAENSCGYLLAHLRPGQRLLDVGCGPGNLTVDLADRVAPGTTVGIDRSADVVTVAGERAGDRKGVSFATGDVYALDAEDGAYDVVHAHQVLQHLSDPVAALREMIRVTAPGGVVAVRDADYGAMTWHPPSPAMDDWLRTYREVARGNGADPDAGRRLVAWAHAAGAENIEATADTWLFATDDDRAFWGGMWADRVVDSDVGRQAVDAGLATSEDLATWSAAFREWASDPDGWFVVIHGELIIRVD